MSRLLRCGGRMPRIFLCFASSGSEDGSSTSWVFFHSYDRGLQMQARNRHALAASQPPTDQASPPARQPASRPASQPTTRKTSGETAGKTFVDLTCTWSPWNFPSTPWNRRGIFTPLFNREFTGCFCSLAGVFFPQAGMNYSHRIPGGFPLGFP